MAITRNSQSNSSRGDTKRRNPSRASRTRNAPLHTRRRQSYAEDSTESDDLSDAESPDPSSSESDSAFESGREALGPEASQLVASRALNQSGSNNGPIASTSTSTARTSSGNTSRAKPNRTAQPRPRSNNKRTRNSRQLGSKKKRKVLRQALPLISNENSFIPDWRDPRIPFECWTDIFLYAAREGSTDILSNSWLIQTATVCRAFSEPALTAIYRCPTVKTSAKARKLASLLERPVEETRFNYRAKVEALHINVQIVPHAILFQLISPLNRLKELIVYTPLDQPPYRELDKTVRWHYPEDLFLALDAAPQGSGTVQKPFPTILKSWEWSGRFIGGFAPTLEAISDIHHSAAFSQLTRLSFTNFQVPSLKNLTLQPGNVEKEMQVYYEDGIVIQAVAAAISQLRTLKHLIFESSTVMNDRLLSQLPNDLLHFELINCWEVKSDDLASFLSTHGNNLRTLTLMHNQSLDLGFLTSLADTCPNLRELHMNLSYYRHHDSYNDSDPMYEQALLPSQIPNWPSSLRVLNIEHIRDWSVESAEVFLQSLIDSAPRLPNLRFLAIKTMLDIPWQSRAKMRIEWRERMEKMFLRPFTAPREHSTLRKPYQKDDNSAAAAPRTATRNMMEPATSPSRRSGRLANSKEDARSEGTGSGKDLRQMIEHPLYKELDTDEDEFNISDDEEQKGATVRGDSGDSATVDRAESSPGFVHGLCTTVNILFDNQKVRELQYSMEDFGSDESDSEEEWDGDYEEDERVFVC